MEPDLPKRKENKNPAGDGTENRKNKSYWKKARVVAVFAIIEVISLVVWETSEDFNPTAAYYIRWMSYCGFLAGAAFLGHKFTGGRFKKRFIGLIWFAWAAMCFVLLFAKSEPSTDESGNPIGLLLPANDPIPLTIPKGLPPGTEKWITDIFSNEPSLSLPTIAANESFLIMGGNIIIIKNGFADIPLIRFHDKDMLILSVYNGKASIAGEFFDRNQDVFAVIANNEFVLDRQNFWRISRPDKSTLIVTSHQNTEVLNIRFCRTNIFEISGIFYFPDGTEAIVTKTYWNYSMRGQGLVTGGSILRGFGGLRINSDGTFSWGFN